MSIFFQAGQRGFVQMIIMAVSDQDVIRSRDLPGICAERRKIFDKPVKLRKHRINKKITVDILNQNAGMFQKRDG